MNLNDLRRKLTPDVRFGTTRDKQHVRNYHPNSVVPQPPHRITRDGEVLAKTTGVSKTCLRCNSDKVMPMRFNGFTLYECMTCRHAWRDDFNKPGPTLRPKEWRSLGLRQGLRPKPWQKLQGRILI